MFKYFKTAGVFTKTKMNNEWNDKSTEIIFSHISDKDIFFMINKKNQCWNFKWAIFTYEVCLNINETEAVFINMEMDNEWDIKFSSK